MGVNQTPKTWNCHACSREITGGSAYFSFGAVVDILIAQRKGLGDADIEGFCHVGYHGTDTNMTDSADYCVANAVKGGQQDVLFCSLKCLRNWFNSIVDYLELESGQRPTGQT